MGLNIRLESVNGTITIRLETENTHHRGKYHCTTNLLFDWFGFYQTSKIAVIATKAKQLNQNKQEVSRTVILPLKLVFSARGVAAPGPKPRNKEMKARICPIIK